ncbi:MAG: efflux RND transporter permease subunit [Candidatus Omnitrophica bacterium]|nr:efflux RND transporter permease subunit [Candidatus Omnitrophota bacterium]
MNLPEFGVRKPVTNLMIFTGIIVISVYALTRLGLDMFPEIEPPALSVITSYYGAGPEEVETKVTEPLENSLAITPGLEKITSRSAEGVSVISLQFKWGTNIDEASNDARDRIDQAKTSLPDIPDEISSPFIFKFNTANIPVLVIGIQADQSYAELYDLVDKRIADSLKQLPGVGTVQIHGGLERQINIWVDRQRLEAYGFSILDVQNVLAQENITQPVGNLKTGLTDYLVRLPGEFSDPVEIQSVILGKRDGKFVYLRDVARIEDSFKESTMVVRVDKHPGLILMVQKQTGTNTVEVAERVKARLAQLIKELPSDVRSNIILDLSEDVTMALDTLKTSLLFAIVFVILVVWFFLRKLFPSMIIALTIPFSLLISFIYLFLAGKTINMISLSSLAIASGMVVDNAIVIVDNIFRRLETGARTKEAAIFGTNEMFLSIAASTLTTVVVFLPMFFITGIVGVFFAQLAAIVTVTLLASLFTAATFSPMLCSIFLKARETNGGVAPQKGISVRLFDLSEKFFKGLEEFYARALAWSLHRKALVIAVFTVVFFASLFLTAFVGNEFIPEEDTGDLRISVYLPIGMRLEESDKVAKRIEAIFEKLPGKEFSYVRAGQAVGMGRVSGQASGSHIITAGVRLVDKTRRDKGVKEIAQNLREEIRRLPGVVRTDVGTGSPLAQMMLGTGGKSIEIEVLGNSFDDTNMVAEKIKAVIEKIPGAVDVSISREANRPELRIEIDREKAASLGLNMQTVSSQIKTFVEGESATKYREAGRTYDIFVRLEEFSRSRIEDIENLSVISPYTGKLVRLSNFARIYETSGPLEIERKNRERVVFVQANTFQRSSGKIVEDIKKELHTLVLPQNVSVSIGGTAEEQRKAFRDLTILLSLGIFLVYMVIAAQFESLLDPFIIMFSIPFTFVGVIVAFVVTHMTLNIMSFLGMVMLMGIVVNNAIVLISYINILRARGYSMFQAVTIGGRDRLRPVLMTTITTLFGLLPLAMAQGEGSETWQPIGISMIGGLTVSTLITMIFVPTLYAVFHRKAAKKQADACPVPTEGKNE